ncbi:MAG: hypothetical protein ACTHQ3_12780 [Motilibacteraceae bacterium]
MAASARDAVALTAVLPVHPVRAVVYADPRPLLVACGVCGHPVHAAAGFGVLVRDGGDRTCCLRCAEVGRPGLGQMVRAVNGLADAARSAAAREDGARLLIEAVELMSDALPAALWPDAGGSAA